jgi:N-acyl-D-aspartate/D-glutamate deacylase
LEVPVNYDVVIRNGTIVDGTGLGSYTADIGIRGSTIVKIGKIQEQGTEQIEADGQVVTPGFIDSHTHMDAQIFWDKLGTSSCWHGVTTAVIGNCGFTLAPGSKEQRQLVLRNLERAEDIPGEAIETGIEWTWTTFREFLDTVDRLPKGMNYAAQIGHSALRTYVMGERAFTEAATTVDLDRMAGELEDAMTAGAFGFSTSRDVHETPDDRPVASRVATWDEIRFLVGRMGQRGGGVFQLFERPPKTDVEFGDQRDRFATLSAEAGVPIAINVLARPGTPELHLLDAVAAAGGRLVGLSHSRGTGSLASFKSRLPFDSLPEWRAVRELPIVEQGQLLRDPVVRQRLVWAAHHGAYRRAISAEQRAPDFLEMRVLERPCPPHLTVADMARQRGVDPVALIIDLALETDFEQFFFQPFSQFDYDATKAVLRHPRTAMTLSDSGAHVSLICDSSIFTHLLQYWVRERQEFTIEEAVRMVTLAPSRIWGFHNRGLLREGFVADINVFDPGCVGPAMPTVINDLPGGLPRIKQKANGFLATLVGGQVVHLQGEHTGALPGRLIRGAVGRSTITGPE